MPYDSITADLNNCKNSPVNDEPEEIEQEDEEKVQPKKESVKPAFDGVKLQSEPVNKFDEW